MKTLKKHRETVGLSQRGLAGKAHISYKSLQLVEGGCCDPRLSTVERIATALGYPPHLVRSQVQTIFSVPPDAIRMIAARICNEGEGSWKIWLFNFVDAFRRHKEKRYIEDPPVAETPEKIRALLAATVETLCGECGLWREWRI